MKSKNTHPHVNRPGILCAVASILLMIISLTFALCYLTLGVQFLIREGLNASLLFLSMSALAGFTSGWLYWRIRQIEHQVPFRAVLLMFLPGLGISMLMPFELNRLCEVYVGSSSGIGVLLYSVAFMMVVSQTVKLFDFKDAWA